VNRHSGKWPLPPENEPRDTASNPGQPRRIGQIKHDDRGAAYVEWRHAPPNEERQVFEIEEPGGGRDDTKLRRGFEPTLEVKADDTFNPYDRKPNTFGGNPATGAPQSQGNSKGGKRDLKKLSEWLKLMRAMEERKKSESEG
jgi:hypothetical protein